MTTRPLYCPQALQARWGMQKAPQLGHAMIAGAASFHVEERLLSRLCLDTFPFGTAMLTPPDNGCFEQLYFNLYPKAAQAQQILDHFFCGTHRGRG